MKVLLIAPYVNLIYDKSTKLENREDFYRDNTWDKKKYINCDSRAKCNTRNGNKNFL